jgi:formylglycine-generating enzyme required for sulfatase activity
MITFRSGPPGYIYDHHGQLVEWTQDVWEAPIEWSEWSEASRRGYVCSFEQVLTLMDQEMNLFNKRLLSSYVEEGWCHGESRIMDWGKDEDES